LGNTGLAQTKKYIFFLLLLLNRKISETIRKTFITKRTSATNSSTFKSKLFRFL